MAQPVIALSPEPLDVAALVARVQTPEHGAVCTFQGVTRETSPEDQRPVVALQYEAYPTVALPEMEKIARETAAQFGPLGIAIVHRTGRVALTEPSVVVVVAAPHRAKSFEACRYAIDELKARVAVWKQEVYRDGDTAWVANTPS
jgi:molybdopterin synthase catalytic subunit